MPSAAPIEAMLSLTALAWGLPARRSAGRTQRLRQRAIALRARSAGAALQPLRAAVERTRPMRVAIAA